MSFTFQPMMESRPIREIAYDVLKKAIITGEIPAGERIVETEYADRLHISRTPLREALRKLERDGLVEYVMRRGVIVHAFTTEDVDQIYTIRNALEMLTLPYIIENATAEDIASLREKLAEMDKLESVSQQITAAMNEISVGVNEINNSMQEVNNITKENSESIERVSGEIGMFKVEEEAKEAESESAENGAEEAKA